MAVFVQHTQGPGFDTPALKKKKKDTFKRDQNEILEQEKNTLTYEHSEYIRKKIRHG